MLDACDTGAFHSCLMSGEKVLLILCVISFALGALLPVFATDGGLRSTNWISLGLCFGAAVWLLKAT